MRAAARQTPFSSSLNPRAPRKRESRLPGRPTSSFSSPGDSSSPPEESWGGRRVGAGHDGPTDRAADGRADGGGDRCRRDRYSGRDGCRSRPPRRFTEPGTMPGGAGPCRKRRRYRERGPGGSSRMRFPRPKWICCGVAFPDVSMMCNTWPGTRSRERAGFAGIFDQAS